MTIPAARPSFSTLFSAFALLAAFALNFASAAHAQVPAIDLGNNAEQGSNFNQDEYSLGWKFTTNQSITVTALGFYDADKDGLAVSHPVGIYDSQCQLLASATVTPQDMLLGYFRYHLLTAPIVLQAGQTFLIAGLTTKPDKYLLNPPTLNADPSINFGGFAIFGNTQRTTTLQCPNGTQSATTRGDFGPSFLIGGGTIPNPNPTIAPGAKRPTAIQLFCNRKGVNLETAECTATVADAGPPPRTLPTGAVTFAADNGFFPATGSCFPTQTPLSPGIGSCLATFAIPFGFPLGARFPIDATYEGDANFESSSTSHALIISTGIFSLDFPAPPQIANKKLKNKLICGPSDKPGGKPSNVGCQITALSVMDLAKILADLTPAEFRLVANQITTPVQSQEPALKNFKKAAATLSDAQLATILTSRVAGVPNPELIKLLKTGKASGANKALYEPARKGGKNSKKKKRKAQIEIKAGQVSAKLPFNSEKETEFKLPKLAQSVVQIFDSAGFDTVPFEFRLTGKQAGKKPVKSESSVEVGLGE